MLRSEPMSETVPCPKCRGDMSLVVITPHPIAADMDRHTYLCRPCNQTKTYVLPGVRGAVAPDKAKVREIPW
jgi:hypothetical protein